MKTDSHFLHAIINKKFFTVYRVQASEFGVPLATVLGKIGNKNLAQSICEYLNRTSCGDGQTSYIWTNTDWSIAFDVDDIVRRILSCESVDKVGCVIRDSTNRKQGEHRTAIISELVYHLKRLADNEESELIDAALSEIQKRVYLKSWKEVEYEGRLKEIEQAAVPPAV